MFEYYVENFSTNCLCQCESERGKEAVLETQKKKEERPEDRNDVGQRREEWETNGHLATGQAGMHL